MKDLREMHVDGNTVPMDETVADVADLLLSLTVGTDHVTRKRLRSEWAAMAADLRQGQTTERAAKGNVTSHVLKNCLAQLEKVGATRRIGQAPRDAVVVLDRGRLRAAVDLWA